MGCINKKLIPNQKYEKEIKYLQRGISFKIPERYIKVPCKECINCLAKKASETSSMMLLEYIKRDFRGIFVTLTYDEETVPLVKDTDEQKEKDEYYNLNIYETEYADFELYDTRDGKDGARLILDYKGEPIKTCRREDVIKLNKSLRRQIEYNGWDKCGWDKDFKFVACSEYGEEGNRPHYHLVYLGISSNGEMAKKVFEKLWREPNAKQQRGIVDVKGLTGAEAINYVCKYTMKELNWQDETDVREKPKVWHSIGLDKNITEMFDIKELEKNNFKYKYGNRDWKIGQCSQYMIHKWNKKIRKDYTEIRQKMKEERIQPLNNAYYTIDEIEQYLQQVAEQKARTRIKKLEQKGTRIKQKYESDNQMEIGYTEGLVKTIMTL